MSAFLFNIAFAMQESGKVVELQPPKVLDLVFTVSDIGGTVQDLQVKELGNEVQIELNADVLFEFDKADILPKAEDTLQKAAAIIKERSKGMVMITGHTDSKGGDAYNQKLSEKRANSVGDWLKTKGGLGNTRFETKGFGAKQPVAPNQKPDGRDDPEGRQKNRRVEITIKTT